MSCLDVSCCVVLCCVVMRGDETRQDETTLDENSRANIAFSIRIIIIIMIIMILVFFNSFWVLFCVHYYLDISTNAVNMFFSYKLSI